MGTHRLSSVTTLPSWTNGTRWPWMTRSPWGTRRTIFTTITLEQIHESHVTMTAIKFNYTCLPYIVFSTLPPGDPSRPGWPSDPGLPCLKGGGGERWFEIIQLLHKLFSLLRDDFYLVYKVLDTTVVFLNKDYFNKFSFQLIPHPLAALSPSRSKNCFQRQEIPYITMWFSPVKNDNSLADM